MVQQGCRGVSLCGSLACTSALRLSCEWLLASWKLRRWVLSTDCAESLTAFFGELALSIDEGAHWLACSRCLKSAAHVRYLHFRRKSSALASRISVIFKTLNVELMHEL